MKIKLHNSLAEKNISNQGMFWANEVGRVCSVSFLLFKRKGIRISFGKIGKDTETGNTFFCPESKKFIKEWERRRF